MGAGTYKLLQNLAAPADVNTWKIDEILGKLQAHFQPKVLVVMESYHFYQRIQKKNEAIIEYLAKLRRLAAKCNFGQFLERALRDKFVCGIKNEIILQRLLSELDIIVTKALELTQAVEAADKNTCKITNKIPDFGQIAKINDSYLKINNSRSMRQIKFQPRRSKMWKNQSRQK